jgi:hypothetical protein
MAGLDPAIHVFLDELHQSVDARLKAGHDEFQYQPTSIGSLSSIAHSPIEAS